MPWKKIISRGEHPVLLVDALVTGMSEYALRKLLNLEFGIKKYKRVLGDCFLDNEEFDLLVGKIKEKIHEDPHYLGELTNNYLKSAKRLAAKAKVIHDMNIKNKSSEQINQLFIEFMEEYHQSTFFFYIPLFIEKILETEIKSDIVELIHKKKLTLSVNQLLNVVTVSSKDTMRKKQEIDLLTIAATIVENELLKKEFGKKLESIIASLKKYRKLHGLIKEYLENYAWINTYLFQFEEYHLEEIIKEIKELIKENPRQQLQIIKTQHQEQQKKYAQLVKELKLSSSLLKKLEYVQEWNYLRACRVDLYAMIHYCTKALFEAVAQNLGLTYHELLQLTYKEIVGIMKFGLFNRQLLESRKKGHGWIMEEGKARICTGYKLDEIKEQEPELEKLKDNKLFGTSAYSGIVEGKVHVVNYPYDKAKVKHFKKGDILVAKMTSADYTPLIKKAGAIVTDEGGLLCHALIIAREFHTPCLIGTNVATKYLEDGFTVKVNADEGYVKIVKKHD